MSRTFEVITPEQVAIRYELAGFGSRALAALFDSLIQLLILLVLLIVVQLVFFFIKLAFAVDISFAQTLEKYAESFLIAVATLILFLIFWGYYIIFEANYLRNNCSLAF
jgi:uncharacterized RDD family membrane protein YckC